MNRLLKLLGQSALARLLVERGNVVARPLHHVHHFVEGDAVLAVAERGVELGVEGTAGRKGVALDARDLDEAADGVAGHAEVVLQAHLRRILYLRRRAAEELAGGRRSHGAGHTDLALASHLRAGDRGVVLDDVAEDAGRGQSMEDARLGEIVEFGQMDQHARHHATGSTRRGRGHRAAGGILLAHGQGIGEDAATALQRRLVGKRLRIVGRGLAGQVQGARERALVVDATVDGTLHHLPHLAQVVPDVLVLAKRHILPVATTVVLTPAEDVLGGVEVIDLLRAEALVLLALALRQGAAADAIDRPLLGGLVVAVEGDKLHAVGVELQKLRRFPHDLHGGGLAEHLLDGHVGHVALAGGSQAAVERHLEAVGVGMALEEDLCRPLRPHGVAARRSFADSEYFFDRFHVGRGKIQFGDGGKRQARSSRKGQARSL